MASGRIVSGTRQTNPVLTPCPGSPHTEWAGTQTGPPFQKSLAAPAANRGDGVTGRSRLGPKRGLV